MAFKDNGWNLKNNKKLAGRRFAASSGAVGDLYGRVGFGTGKKPRSSRSNCKAVEDKKNLDVVPMVGTTPNTLATSVFFAGSSCIVETSRKRRT